MPRLPLPEPVISHSVGSTRSADGDLEVPTGAYQDAARVVEKASRKSGADTSSGRACGYTLERPVFFPNRPETLTLQLIDLRHTFSAPANHLHAPLYADATPHPGLNPTEELERIHDLRLNRRCSFFPSWQSLLSINPSLSPDLSRSCSGREPWV